MIIDPYKSVNKNVNTEVLNSRMDRIVNDIIEFLIEEYSEILGTSGFDTKSRVVAEKVIREKLSKDYNYSNYDLEELIKIILDRIFGYHILQKYIEVLKPLSCAISPLFLSVSERRRQAYLIFSVFIYLITDMPVFFLKRRQRYDFVIKNLSAISSRELISL